MNLKGISKNSALTFSIWRRIKPACRNGSAGRDEVEKEGF